MLIDKLIQSTNFRLIFIFEKIFEYLVFEGINSDLIASKGCTNLNKSEKDYIILLFAFINFDMILTNLIRNFNWPLRLNIQNKNVHTN